MANPPLEQPIRKLENNACLFLCNAFMFLWIYSNMMKYYQEKLELVKSNAKRTWQLINEVLNKRQSAKKIPSNIKFNNQDLSDSSQIAKHFC